jgi:hypothetical protein
VVEDGYSQVLTRDGGGLVSVTSKGFSPLSAPVQSQRSSQERQYLIVICGGRKEAIVEQEDDTNTGTPGGCLKGFASMRERNFC